MSKHNRYMGTAHKQHDARLLRIYERLYRYTHELVVVLTDDGDVLEANERSISFFSGEIEGKNIKTLFEGIELSLSSLFETEVIQSVIAHTGHGKGKGYTFLLSFIPIDGTDRARELLVIGKDMSETEHYREQVESLNARLKQLEDEQRNTLKSRRNKEKTIALSNALKKLERTKGELEKINLTLTKELELAAALQKSLVPHNIPDDQYLRFAFHYEPMQFVGGDYYDVTDLGDGRKGLIIADVSGHGVSSAFIAAMMKISFLNYAQKIQSPAMVLTRLNEEYCKVIQTGDFVTVFYGVIDPLNNKMTYCGAGHPRPIFLHRENSTIELLSSEGFFIGMFDQAEYTDKVVDLRRHDRFMAFTDGIIEAFSDERGEQFGEKRLLECFRDFSDEPIDRVIKNTINRVKSFMKKSIFYDDLAIVAVEYK